MKTIGNWTDYFWDLMITWSQVVYEYQRQSGSRKYY
jgi:hypothetical protein